MIANGLFEVVRAGGSHLGVDTGIASNSPTLRKLAGQQRKVGWIIRGERKEPWKAAGFVEREGQVLVYGPLHHGRFLEDALEDESVDRLELLARVAGALATVVDDEDIPVFPFHTRSMIVLEDGGILILPADILQAIREHQDYAAEIRRMERFTHPDRSHEANYGFALAAAAYYVITGHFPYDAEDEEDLHARVRSATMISAKHRDVAVRDEISDALDARLKGDEEAVDLRAWTERLRAWSREGVRTTLSEEERERREQAADQTIARMEKGFQRRERVRKHGRTAVIIAVIVILVGTIPGTIIRNALQPRATAGLPPEEVVRVFYESINSLDHMTMEDAVVDDAGRGLIREVTNLYVLDRQRMSVEMQSAFVDAREWLDSGMPELSDGRTPYGVTNLLIIDEPAPEGERLYTVRYERWLPDYEQAQETGQAGAAGLRAEDRVSLRMDGDDWVIYEIERLSEEPIDVEELRERQGSPPAEG